MAKGKGFTLVEILIVMLILGILAMIAVPKFMQASQEARESALKSDLWNVRSQLELYKAQHGGKYPQDIVGSNSAAWISQLASSTNSSGSVKPSSSSRRVMPVGDTAPTYPLGPYLKEFPANAFVSGDTATAVEFGTQDPPPGDGKTGWYLNTQTGKFSPNDDKKVNPAHAGY